MATSATTYGGYPLQDSGDNLNTWGTDSTAGLNNAISLLAEGVHSVLTVALTGNTTLTSTNYASNQFRRRGLILTDGGLSSAPTVTAPSVQSVYLIWNATGYTVSFKTSGGSAVSLATGMGHVVSCDATSMYVLTARRLDQIDAPTSAVDVNSQKITSLATGTATTDAVNKGQMDTAIASAGIPASSGAVLISANDTTARYLGTALAAGNAVALTETNDGADETLTVAVDVVGLTAETSTDDADLVLIYDNSAAAYRKMTKANLVSNLLAKSGGTMTGAINLDGNNITMGGGKIDTEGGEIVADLTQFPFNAVGNSGTSTLTIAKTTLDLTTVTATGDFTINVTAPDTDQVFAKRVRVTMDGTGARDITVTRQSGSSNIYWPQNASDTTVALDTTAYGAGAIFDLWFEDDGTQLVVHYELIKAGA